MKVIIIFLMTFQVYADFNGSYTARAALLVSDDQSAQCTDVGFQFFQDEKYFIVRNGYFKCLDFVVEHPYSMFKIDGDNLVYEGKVHGKIAGDKLFYYHPEAGYQFHLRKEGGHLIHNELWYDQDEFFLVSSVLKELTSEDGI